MNYFLFARPSFLGGVAHVLDLGNTLWGYNESLTPHQADFLALKNDWNVVGDDLSHAVDEAEESFGNSRLAHSNQR